MGRPGRSPISSSRSRQTSPPALDAASAVLLGNVARASHGETVRAEVLGNGDASRAFQRFALKKRPLTYVPGEAPCRWLEPARPVDGVRWDEAPALYGERPTDRVLARRTGDDGTAIVQFGDGKTGARVPTGEGNITATYRTGRVRRGPPRAR